MVEDALLDHIVFPEYQNSPWHKWLANASLCACFKLRCQKIGEYLFSLYSQPFVKTIPVVQDTPLDQGGDCPRVAPLSCDTKPTQTLQVGQIGPVILRFFFEAAVCIRSFARLGVINTGRSVCIPSTVCVSFSCFIIEMFPESQVAFERKPKTNRDWGWSTKQTWESIFAAFTCKTLRALFCIQRSQKTLP